MVPYLRAWVYLVEASVLVVGVVIFTSLLCFLFEFEVFVESDCTKCGFESSCTIDVSKERRYACASAQEEGYGKGVVSQLVYECPSGVGVVRAGENEVEDRFAMPIATVWA